MELRGLEPLAPACQAVLFQLSYSPRKLKIYRKVEASPLTVFGRGQSQR